MRMRSRAASAVSAACRHRPQAPTPPAIPATSRPRIRCLQRVAGASPPRVDILDAVARAAAHQAICRVQADALPGRQSRKRLFAEPLATWFTTWTHRLGGPAPAIRDIRHRCGPHERTAGGTACSVHEARTARAHSPVTGLCRGPCRSGRKRTCASTLSMASRPAARRTAHGGAQRRHRRARTSDLSLPAGGNRSPAGTRRHRAGSARGGRPTGPAQCAGCAGPRCRAPRHHVRRPLQSARRARLNRCSGCRRRCR